jgi:4-aminobutyrate aminotransferase-like enzyme
MAERASYLNPKLAINYSEAPLKVAWMKGTTICEMDGQRNLDCINNVAIIGHSHP